MKIILGSKNPSKLAAVREIVVDYPFLADAKVIGKATSSGVSDQPKSTEETVQGAVNRAKNAYEEGCDFAIGIEAGIIPFPQTKTGYMDIGICVIYDGKEIHMGATSLFEYPKKVIDLVLNEGMEISDTAKHVGFDYKKRIGDEGGMIGALTKGRLPRKEYIKEAIRNALIHLENPELY